MAHVSYSLDFSMSWAAGELRILRVIVLLCQTGPGIQGSYLLS